MFLFKVFLIKKKKKEGETTNRRSFFLLVFENGLGDVQRKELLFSILGGNEFKLSRITGNNKKIPTKAFDGYYNSNKPKGSWGKLNKTYAHHLKNCLY